MFRRVVGDITMKMTSANQLKAKIKKQAQLKGVDPRVLMRLYMMERFLERVAHSNYRDNFVLKGGMLISYLVGVNLRTTMDIDTTMQNIAFSEQDVRNFIYNVISIDVNDGVNFTLERLDTIMETFDYPGIRASLIANFDGTETSVKIDISTGHIITPRAIKTTFPLMFADAISLPAYPVATILAEKLQTILGRAEFNTRMRDFYDIHALRIIYGNKLEQLEIAQAFYATAEARETLYLLKNKNELFLTIKNSDSLNKQWSEYRKKAAWPIDVSWNEVMEDLQFFLTLV